MGENKGQTIFLSVIGIATLLVAIIGATFAYFTTTVTGDNGQTSTFNTATVANVVMQSSNVSVSDILPGKETAEQTITLSTSIDEGSSVTIPYTCVVSKSGVVTDLQYKVSGADNTTYGSWTDIDGTTSKWTGTLTAANTSDVYKFTARMQETGTVQNGTGVSGENANLGQSGAQGIVTVTCNVDGTTRYYTNGVPGGQTEPVAPQAN